jgi:hypothetical protein
VCRDIKNRIGNPPLTARPPVDVPIELLPPAQVEVAGTEIRSLRQVDGLAQGRQQLLINVVEDARHRTLLSCISFLSSY